MPQRKRGQPTRPAAKWTRERPLTLPQSPPLQPPLHPSPAAPRTAAARAGTPTRQDDGPPAQPAGPAPQAAATRDHGRWQKASARREGPQRRQLQVGSAFRSTTWPRLVPPQPRCMLRGGRTARASRQSGRAHTIHPQTCVSIPGVISLPRTIVSVIHGTHDAAYTADHQSHTSSANTWLMREPYGVALELRRDSTLSPPTAT